LISRFSGKLLQVGQPSQTNRAATWAVFGKNKPRPISAKSVQLTSF